MTLDLEKYEELRSQVFIKNPKAERNKLAPKFKKAKYNSNIANANIKRPKKDIIFQVNTKMELMILQLINLLFWMRTEGGLMVEEIKTDIGYTEIKLDDIQLVQTQQTILHRINLKYIQETLIEIKNSPITNYTIDQRTYLSQEIQNLEQQYLTLLPGQYIHQHIY
ncbi:unnamed protein product [Hermetia illucens]|uniref:Uncharacterized protein n=1 Tax=Hermetia illucens TaxID=343691 RepID=A0A7R8UJ45_HERIL|nr:unnamed protein product [Hermetia illucens]